MMIIITHTSNIVKNSRDVVQACRNAYEIKHGLIYGIYPGIACSK